MILDTTLQKVGHFLERVSALRAGDFAQGDSEAALEDIATHFATFRAQLTALRAAGADPAVAENHCRVVLHHLFAYLPILGFLHRSKSASNAFELYDPLRDLARRLLGDDTRVILSSEWAFSPFTYPRMLDFPRYVLIGLPASESRNALLVPLAGHEMGHSAWLRSAVGDALKRPIRDALVTQIRARVAAWQALFPQFADETALNEPEYMRAWSPAYEWAQRQCEEVYCDFLGLRLFDAAYLHAFAYLVAPGLPGRRAPHYPTLRQRADYLQEAAMALGIPVAPQYAEQFGALPSAGATGTTREEFLITLADGVTSAMRADLLSRTHQLVDGAGLPPASAAEVEAIQRRFAMLAPADAPTSLAAPVNAAWRLAGQPDLWADYPHVAERRHAVLSELVAKSAQVLEYNKYALTPPTAKLTLGPDAA